MNPLLSTFHLRARELGLSYPQLARMSGISLPTIKRIFAGKHRGTSYAKMQKLAEVLGLTIAAEPLMTAEQLREQRARAKAERLIKHLQATSALEGQALSPDQRADMVRKTTYELLAGSSRRLWGD